MVLRESPAEAPPLTLTPGGSVGGVLGEAAGGGGPVGAELAWQSDRDYSQEAAFQNVAAGLLLGRSHVTDGAGKVAPLARNLFTEAEHAAHRRAGRDLLGDAKRLDGDSADEIARRGPDDEGVAYLRDNADELADELSTKQAKAAQTLLDTYTALAPVRPAPKDLADRIPPNGHEQARWITRARGEVGDALDGLPTEVAEPLRERLYTLADGNDPARWFTAASELSDDLLRARAKATRAAPESVEAIGKAKALLDAGLKTEGLWGSAGKAEGQRAAGFERRYGEHIAQFEELFTAEVDGKRRVDPAKFRELLDAPDDSESARTLKETLDSARVTADVARQFGRKDEAKRIESSVALLEKTQRQAKAVKAARPVARETDDPAAAALTWLTQGVPGLEGDYLGRQLLGAAQGTPNATAEVAASRLAARDGVFKATASMSKLASEGNRRGVQRLLSAEDDDDTDGLDLAPPRNAALSSEDFEAHREHLDKLAADPSYFGEVMAASFGTMPEAAPEVFAALSVQAAKTVRYLAAVAPGGSTGGPFAQRFPVSEDELWEYNQRLRAVADPEFIRDELSTGRLSSQAVEAFEMMNSKQYAQLQRDVFERLQELQAQGVKVPIQAREQLDTLLNLDGGGEPGLTWKVAERAYAATARKNASSSGQVPEGNGQHAGAMTSGALSTLGNGASAIAQTG